MIQKFISFWNENDIWTNFRMIMGILFIFFGIYIGVGDWMPYHLRGQFQYLMAAIMIAYGIFRIVHISYRKNLQRRIEMEKIKDEGSTNEYLK